MLRCVPYVSRNLSVSARPKLRQPMARSQQLCGGHVQMRRCGSWCRCAARIQQEGGDILTRTPERVPEGQTRTGQPDETGQTPSSLHFTCTTRPPPGSPRLRPPNCHTQYLRANNTHVFEYQCWPLESISTPSRLGKPHLTYQAQSCQLQASPLPSLSLSSELFPIANTAASQPSHNGARRVG